MQSDMGAEPVVREGAMFKKSPAIWRNWQERWFILCRNSLCWYRFRTDVRSDMRGGVALTRIRTVTMYGKLGNKLQIDIGDRTVYLKFQSAEILQLWCAPYMYSAYSTYTIVHTQNRPCPRVQVQGPGSPAADTPGPAEEEEGPRRHFQRLEPSLLRAAG